MPTRLPYCPLSNHISSPTNIDARPLSSGIKHQILPSPTTLMCQESNRLDLRCIRPSGNQVILIIPAWLDVGSLEDTKVVLVSVFFCF